MRKIFVVFCTLVFTCLLSANGQNKVKKVIPLGGVIGGNAILLPQGKFVTVLKPIFVEKKYAYDGNNKLSKDSKNRDFKIANYNLILRYGMSPKLEARLVMSYLDKSFKTNNGMRSVDASNKGIGDVKAWLRYQLTSQKMGDKYFSAINIGLNLPVGKSDKTFYAVKNSDVNNKIAMKKPYGAQLTDGSLDPIIGFDFTKILNKHRIDSSLTYFFNQKGDNEFEAGDEFMYNFAYSYLLHSKFAPFLEFNGDYKAQSKANSEIISDTGGSEIFLTPGFGSHITKKIKFFLGYSIPVYRNLHYGAVGTQKKLAAKFTYVW